MLLVGGEQEQCARPGRSESGKVQQPRRAARDLSPYAKMPPARVRVVLSANQVVKGPELQLHDGEARRSTREARVNHASEIRLSTAGELA